MLEFNEQDVYGNAWSAVCEPDTKRQTSIRELHCVCNDCCELYEEPLPTLEPLVDDDEYNLQRGIQMSLESFQPHVGGVAICEPTLSVTRSVPVVEGKGKGIATDEQAALSLLDLRKPKKKSIANQYIIQKRIPMLKLELTENSNNEGDTEILNVDEERGENVSNIMALEERTVKLDESQAGSDPGNTLESRPPPNEDQSGSNPRQRNVALARPNPEPMHKDFIATVYPKVHKSLKHPTEEHVFLKNPLSSSGTLSLIKNLDDAFTFGDQFINDKSLEDEPGKAIVDTKVESMVPVPIPSSFFIYTTATTTTLPPPPPPQQQSIMVHELATRVYALEKICANFEKKHKLQDKTTQALSSRVFTLENHDLYSKIDN
ncbi:hypothetical protein Tco_0072678 [Tanacetum coccineum]